MSEWGVHPRHRTPPSHVVRVQRKNWRWLIECLDRHSRIQNGHAHHFECKIISVGSTNEGESRDREWDVVYSVRGCISNVPSFPIPMDKWSYLFVAQKSTYKHTRVQWNPLAEYLCGVWVILLFSFCSLPLNLSREKKTILCTHSICR